MSYIEDKIDKDVFLDRIFRKSKSEASRRNGEIALRNLEVFCKHQYQKNMDIIIDDLIELNNSKKTHTFFQNFVDFMGDDHPDILWKPSSSNSKAKSYTAKMPTSIKGYISKARKYAKMRGLNIDLEDFSDNIILPTIEEELDPDPFTHDEIRLMCNHASPRKKLLYMAMKDSGARNGELCQVRKRDVDFSKNPVEIHLPAKITKGRKSRLIYITRETAPDLKNHTNHMNELDLVFGTNENPRQSVENEISYFKTLREKLSKINPVFGERYSHNNRFKKNIHSLRAFTATQADDVHGENYAHGLIGHKKYLSQYIRDSKKNPEKYKKLEPKLLIYEKITLEGKEELEERLMQQRKDNQKLEDKVARQEQAIQTILKKLDSK